MPVVEQVIAADIPAQAPGSLAVSPLMFAFNNALYVFTVVIGNDGGLLTISKSTDHGATWTQIFQTPSYFPLVNPFQNMGVALFGTKAYILHEDPANGIPDPPFSTVVFRCQIDSFDFSSETYTFNVVPSSNGSPLVEQSLSNYARPTFVAIGDTEFWAASEHFLNSEGFVGQDNLTIYHFSGGVWSSNNLPDSDPRGLQVRPQSSLMGASGTFHTIFYRAVGPSSGVPVPATDLCYLSPAAVKTTIQAAFWNGWITGGQIMSNLLQHGSNIMFAYDDVANGQNLTLCTFTDAGAPVFSTQIIEPNWWNGPIGGFPDTNEPGAPPLLFEYAGTIYLFYTKSVSFDAATGDGTVYYRTSIDGGITWSARITYFQHTEGAGHTNVGWIYGPAPVSGTAIDPLQISYLAFTNFVNTAWHRWILVRSQPPPIVILSACPSSSATLLIPYSDGFIVLGGTPPFTFAIILGGLPTGLVLDPNTGLVFGTPTAVGFFSYTAQVTDSLGQTSQKSCSISVQSLTCPTGQAMVQVPYSSVIIVAGGKGPHNFKVVLGQLPPGLTLNTNTGALTGIPQFSGTFTFTTQATDSTGATVQKECSIVVVAHPSTQLIFQGVRRVPGKLPKLVDDYPYKPHLYTYVLEALIDFTGEFPGTAFKSFFQTIENFDFDWYDLKITYDGPADVLLPEFVTALILYDPVKQQMSGNGRPGDNGPPAVLDVFYNGAPGTRYENGAINPVLTFPKQAQIRIDVYSLITDPQKLPIKAKFHIVGVNRIPYGAA